MPTRICLTGIFVALFFAFAPAGAQTVIDLEKIKQFNLAEYPCLRADGEITIDGRLDEQAWQAAPWSTPFVDIVSGEQAFFDSRVKLLWDERCLYLGYRAEETHVRATLTGRDSRIWEDNDVELFIAGKDAYYELEINALNTIYEVFWIWDDILGKPGSPYPLADWPTEKRRTDKLSNYVPHLHPRGDRTGYFDFDLPGLRHAVHVDGVLNDDSVTDKAWSVELAIPWAALSPLADGRALPPQHGDIWRIDCSRFQHRGRDGALLKECAGWTWNRHGYMNSHIPETFTRVKFSTDQAR